MMQSNPTAPHPGAACGARLTRARQAAGLTPEDVSARLKIPVRVIRDLEADDWSSLGAPVYVRGQLRSYARLLGLDIETELAAIPLEVAPAVLVSHTHTPRLRRVAEQVARRAVYIAITAAIAVPVWIATSPHLGNNPVSLQSLDIQTTGNAAAPGTADARTPLVASFGSLPQAAMAETPALSLTFRGDSWVQVYATDGRPLERGVLRAGQVRRYAVGEVGRIVLGDASVVTVEQAGKSVDLAPFSRANVARFTLSSGGSLAPIRY